MSLSKSLSERNVYVKFEKGLGTISPLKPNSFKGSKGNPPPPLFLLFLALQASEQLCSADCRERK